MKTHIIDFSVVSTQKLNPLGSSLRGFILRELASAESNPAVSSIVLTGGKNGNFSAGADLTEFASFLEAKSAGSGPTLVDVVRKIEACPKPVVAAISGACLGGGCEVVLACHYRVCVGSSTAKIGLPEVHVGVIPGAGGTQRMPRLIGLPQACRLILTGIPVKAAQALQLKLVDALVENGKELIPTAIKWASWAETMPSMRRTSELPLQEPPIHAHVILQTASLQLPKLGMDGPRAALEAMRAAYTSKTFEEGMQAEADLFLQTLLAGEGNAKRHAFFAVRAAQKLVAIPSHTAAALKNHPLINARALPKPVTTAVIGAGTMGSGIAMVLLQAGFEVYLVDVNKTALDKGLAFLHDTMTSRVKRGKLKPQVAADLKSRLKSTQNLQDLSSCVLVVEAVIENMKIKQSIFQTLNKVTPPDAILLSNTSTLDVDQMAAALSPSRRPRFAGWHFFSPAHVMKLVEIVVGKDTSSETVALLQMITKQRINKTGVVVGNCDGFCGNRMLKPYSAETVLLLVEGNNTVQDVDRAFLDFGMALGPLQMADLAGNDIGYNIRKERGWVKQQGTNTAPPQRPDRYTDIADDMVADLGRLGQKSMKGWYNYSPEIGKGRKALPSPEMDSYIQKYRTVSGAQTKHSPQAMIERVLYPLVNEGFKCLEEGIARSPGDIDVVYLYGYGFPAWRGGPMYWADHDVTLPVLLDTLKRLARQYPTTEHYVPSKLLERCVSLGVTVEDYYKKGVAKGQMGQLSRL